jgi:NAD(P)-dependent dehydrogenase (short-subunit alcohol dehydrogenase family)
MVDDGLRGNVALVTGAGSGLGEATARAFARAGCGVVCVDVNRGAVERISRDLADCGGRSMALTCDVADADAVFRTVEAAAGWQGRLDIAVNCAAIDYTLSVDELTVEQWDRVIAINLRGPFLVAKAALPTMRRQGSGHIVNIASTAALRGWANCSVYHASKYGILGFGRGFGVEARTDGIRVTTVIPGGMRTHFFDRFREQGIPSPDEKNLQDPATVAEAILFAVRVPRESSLQELVLTPMNETSWP